MQFSKFIPALAATALMGAAPLASAQVKIGLTGPMSGPVALVGQDQYDGFMLAVEQLGGKLGGQVATILKEDDQLKPELGNQIVRKLIDKERVHAIVGLGFSNVVMASVKPIVESGTVAIATNSGTSPLAGAGCAANIFSTAWQNDGAPEAMGKYMQDKGIKNVYLLAPNYQAGKDMLTGFKRYFKGNIVEEVYTQVGQTDYSAEIAQVQASNPDAVFAFYPGGMGVNFVKQMSQAGLLPKLPVYSVFMVDGTTMPALREAAVGSVMGMMWDSVLNNPENNKFVKAFVVKHKRVPSEYAAAAFDAAQILDVAFKKVGAKLDDKKALAAAVKAAGAEIRSVRGPFRFNNNNMPVQNYYAFNVVKEGNQVVTRQISVALANHADAYSSKCALK